jgi:protein subunit release factor B
VGTCLTDILCSSFHTKQTSLLQQSKSKLAEERENSKQLKQLLLDHKKQLQEQVKIQEDLERELIEVKAQMSKYEKSCPHPS